MLQDFVAASRQTTSVVHANDTANHVHANGHDPLNEWHRRVDTQAPMHQDSHQSGANQVEMGEQFANKYHDRGYVRHGWKNVYHKEEWGEASKYHDIWR